ncbi:hypothetical protein [uncultured Nocardioides sp.]|uniref:hypothetical protein n=1 Tax=uncultured Nocardioides sp. TaxID=198441 RepID=UPI0026004421|nr:hypothetical protein [uncultured Nocardioides sp.]
MAERWSPRPGRLADVLVCLGLLFASLTFTVEQVLEHEKLSPIDEYQYIDNYAKVLDQGIVRQGEETGLTARRMIVCNGLRLDDAPLNAEACRADDAGGIFALGGGTTGDLYTPIYFFTTRVVAQPFEWAGADLVQGGRLAGGIWLAAGAIVLYLALRRAGTPPALAGAAGLLTIGSLPAYWANTYISTDAPAILAGSLALLLAVEGRSGRLRPLLLLAPVASVMTLVKVQNLVGFVAAGLYLVALAAYDARRSDPGGGRVRRWLLDRRSLAAVTAVVTAVGAQGAWLWVRSRLAVGPSPDDGVGGPFAWTALLAESSSFLQRTAMGALPPPVTGVYSEPLFVIGLAVTLGGVVGLALAQGVPVRDRLLALSAGAVAIVAAPALALSVVVSEGEHFTLPWRYGMSLLPWMIGCCALLADGSSRTVRRSAVVLGLVAFGLSLLLGEG